jgi:signal transduction histidine kinase
MKTDTMNKDSSDKVRSLRNDAEEKLIRSPKRSPGISGQADAKLIHELQVHQIELETQAEELRRSQISLEESRDKYLDLYDFAPIGYLTLSNEAMIEEVNLTCATLLGVERSRLVHARFRRFIAPQDFERWDRHFLNVLNQGEKQSCTIMLRRGDDSTFPARLDSIRTPGSGKEKITVRVAISNISDIRRMEEALALTSRKLTLLSGITRHDIRNQLLTLDGFLALLQDDLPDPRYEPHFNHIKSASSRIAAMIKFTKEYEQLGVNAPSWLNCHTLIETAAKQVQLGKVMVQNDLLSGAKVFADPLIVKVFFNLMDNAVRYGGKITKIRFSLQEYGGVHTLVCEDDGDGVRTEEKKRIFDHGFGRNTGLGLALSKEILLITGITITETGEPGKGARFEMVVPAGAYRVNGI